MLQSTLKIAIQTPESVSLELDYKLQDDPLMNEV